MILKNNSTIVIGSGGHSRPVLENLILRKKKNIKIFDIKFSKKKINNILNQNVVADLKEIEKKKLSKKNKFYLAIGDNKKREMVYNEFNKIVSFPNLISINSYISKFTQLGEGNFFNHFSFVGPNVKMGNNNIINTYSIIEHDVKVGSNNHICPGVKIGGNAKIGNNVFIGLGSTIIHKIKVCSDVTIGAGSVVINDISEPGTYVIKKNKIEKI